jgi:hypothetical protein
MVHKSIKVLDKIAEKSAYWIPTVLLLVAGMTWLAKEIAPIANYGWAADIVAGVFLASLLMGSVGVLLIGWRYLNPLNTKDNSKYIQFPEPYVPISVIGKTYRNERVILDGHAYTNCNFYSVTFVYNGTTSIVFAHNSIINGMMFSSDNPSVLMTTVALKGLGYLKEGALFDAPSESKISDPKYSDYIGS